MKKKLTASLAAALIAALLLAGAALAVGLNLFDVFGKNDERLSQLADEAGEMTACVRRTPGGTRRYAGIGLSVCYTIVKAHGGTIAAENRKNGGAAFRFTVRREKIGDDEQ